MEFPPPRWCLQAFEWDPGPQEKKATKTAGLRPRKGGKIYIALGKIYCLDESICLYILYDYRRATIHFVSSQICGYVLQISPCNEAQPTQPTPISPRISSVEQRSLQGTLDANGQPSLAQPEMGDRPMFSSDPGIRNSLSKWNNPTMAVVIYGNYSIL